MDPTPQGQPTMSNADWRAGLRRRILLPAPALQEPPTGPTPCRQQSHFTEGTVCTCQLDPEGIHEELCNIGGGVNRRHNAVRTWLASKFRELTHCRIAEEYFVPTLDKDYAPSPAHPTGRSVRARIDVITQDDTDTTMYDVVIANIATTDKAELKRRTTEPGRAARLAAIGKRTRYDGHVIPFAIEDTGRLHPQAARTLHTLASHTINPQDTYPTLVAELQTIIFSTSMSFQRTARGHRPL